MHIMNEQHTCNTAKGGLKSTTLKTSFDHLFFLSFYINWPHRSWNYYVFSVTGVISNEVPGNTVQKGIIVKNSLGLHLGSTRVFHYK